MRVSWGYGLSVDRERVCQREGEEGSGRWEAMVKREHSVCNRVNCDREVESVVGVSVLITSVAEGVHGNL